MLSIGTMTHFFIKVLTNTTESVMWKYDMKKGKNPLTIRSITILVGYKSIILAKGEIFSYLSSRVYTLGLK